MEFIDDEGTLFDALPCSRLEVLEAKVFELEEIIEVHMERLYDLERGELFNDGQ